MINQASCARQMGAGWHGSVIQMATFFRSFSIQNRERLMRLGVLKLGGAQQLVSPTTRTWKGPSHGVGADNIFTQIKKKLGKKI
jgi:hypothetical protein